MGAPTVRAAFRCVHRGSLAMVSAGFSTTGAPEGSASAEAGTFNFSHTSSAILRRVFCVRLSTSSQDLRGSPHVTMVSRGRFFSGRN